MIAIRLVAVLFVLPQPLLIADDLADPAKAATPEHEYNTLLEQYNDAFDAYARSFREAKLPEDREKVIREKYPRPDKWASTFLELAEQNPSEPFAEEALIWILTSEARLKTFRPWHEHTARYEMIWIVQTRGGLEGDKHEQEVRGKAIDMLVRDHIASPRMGYVAQMLGRSPKSARLLSAMIDKNPSRQVRAEACLALYRENQARIDLARQLKDNPELAKGVEPFYGSDYVREAQKADLPGLESEDQALYAELTGKYIREMKPARLVQLCQELKYSSDSEKLLRFLYENDERKEVRGVACLILAEVLEGRAFSQDAGDPGAAEKARKESEALLEKAATAYAHVQMPREGSVGKKAQGVLFDMRHLSIGKPAPEIEGLDQDGKEFALSDYKGKVVLLDFWSEF
jgi:hypothetical protein